AIVPGGDLGQDRRRDVLAKDRDLREIRHEDLQKLETLGDQVVVEELRSRDIAARPCKTVDESRGDEIAFGAANHDWDAGRCGLEDLCQARAPHEEHVDLEAYEIRGAGAQLIGGFAEASHDGHVLAIDPAELPHRDPEPIRRDGPRQLLRAWSRTDAEDPHAGHLLRWLR